MPQIMQSGLEILLGRERYAALTRAAHQTGSSIATVIRDAVDSHLDRLEHCGDLTHPAEQKVVDIRGSRGRHRADPPQASARTS